MKKNVFSTMLIYSLVFLMSEIKASNNNSTPTNQELNAAAELVGGVGGFFVGMGCSAPSIASLLTGGAILGAGYLYNDGYDKRRSGIENAVRLGSAVAGCDATEDRSGHALQAGVVGLLAGLIIGGIAHIATK